MDRLDVKLWALAEKGQIVPDRSLLKTPEQIAGIVTHMMHENARVLVTRASEAAYEAVKER